MRKCNVWHIKRVISIRVPKMLVIQQKLRTTVMSCVNGNSGITTSSIPRYTKWESQKERKEKEAENVFEEILAKFLSKYDEKR